LEPTSSFRPVALGGNNAFHLERCLDRCAMRPGVSLKLSLFTRPSVVEDELSAVKRHARRATGEPGRTASGSRRMALAGGASTRRSTAGGAWRRWRRRSDEVLDAVTLWFRGVLTDVQNRLSDVKANRGEKKLRSWAGRPPRTRSHSTEHHTQIVCGHFGEAEQRIQRIAP
jgi:hypothetical protein